jgi:hypothetical protein
LKLRVRHNFLHLSFWSNIHWCPVVLFDATQYQQLICSR